MLIRFGIQFWSTCWSNVGSNFDQHIDQIWYPSLIKMLIQCWIQFWSTCWSDLGSNFYQHVDPIWSQCLIKILVHFGLHVWSNFGDFWDHTQKYRWRESCLTFRAPGELCGKENEENLKRWTVWFRLPLRWIRYVFGSATADVGVKHFTWKPVPAARSMHTQIEKTTQTCDT